ncbi:MAG TPA: hypothetical protein VLB04_02865 [Methanotrichaceae archaeon]|nr:hypothetical protein [Methanotrichaceae archaeon]
MECYDLTMNFLRSRKGKMIKVLIEGGGLKPVTAKLLDFDDAVMVLGMPDGNQWMIDMAYVIQVADAEEEETAASMAEAE